MGCCAQIIDGAASGGGSAANSRSYLTLNPIPSGPNTVANWRLNQIAGTTTNNLVDSVNSITLVPDGGFLSAVTRVGNLSGIFIFANTGPILPGNPALRVADSRLEIAGSMAAHILTTTSGEGTVSSNMFGWFGTGETEPTNNLYQLTNHNVDGGGLSLNHEFGAGTNVLTNFRAEPVGNVPLLISWVRDVSALTYSLFFDGVLQATMAYGTNPSGGSAGEFVLGRDDLLHFACAGLRIDDGIGVDPAADVLAVAQAVNIAA